MRSMTKLVTAFALMLGAAISQAQFWTTSWGTGYTQAEKMTKDSAGNLYICGIYQQATQDMLTLKYDVNGNLQWSATWDGTDSLRDAAYHIALDAAGNVYVTGTSELKTGPYETAVIKYDQNGNFQWASHLLYSNNDDQPFGLTTDLNGGVYVAIKSGTGGIERPVLVKLNAADGTTAWFKLYSFGVKGDVANGFAADSYGHLYISGQTKDSSATRGFVLKTDGTGANVWKYFYADPSNQAAIWGITLDASNDVAFTGYVATVGNVLTGKLDSHGAFKWKQTYDSPYHLADVGYYVKTDTGGGVYVAGATTISNSPPLQATLLLEYSSSGAPLHTWIRSSSNIDQGPAGLAVDKYKRIYLLETVYSPAPTGSEAVLSAYDGSSYAYLYSLDGGGVGYDNAVDMVADDSGYAVFVYTHQLDAGQDFCMTMSRVPQPVVGIDDSYNVGYNHPLVVSAANGVLANDRYTAAVGLKMQLDAFPAHGTVGYTTDGAFTYTPHAGFFGTDSFTYTPQSNSMYGSPATVTLHILPILASLTVPASVIKGGTTAQATVTLNHTAPAGGTDVKLMSSNTLVATVPASVTVPAGQASVNFSITTKTVAAQTTAKVTATYNGNVKVGTVTVGP